MSDERPKSKGEDLKRAESTDGVDSIKTSEDLEEARLEQGVLEDEEISSAVDMIRWSLSEDCPKLPDKQGLLKEVFKESLSFSPEHQENHKVSEQEERQARFLGEACDDLLEGRRVEPTQDEAVDILVAACLMIHSTSAEHVLGEILKRRLIKEALGAKGSIKGASSDVDTKDTGVAGRSPWRRGSWVLGAVALAAGIAAVAFVFGFRFFQGAQFKQQSSKQSLRQARRRVARMVPGPFPEEQSATERVELLYGERLRAHRGNLIKMVRDEKRQVEDTVAGRGREGWQWIPCSSAHLGPFSIPAAIQKRQEPKVAFLPSIQRRSW